jgi:SAM-dependent methyltransferase
MASAGSNLSAASLTDRKAECISRIIQQKSGKDIRNALVVGCGSGVEAAILANVLGVRVIGVDLQNNFDPVAAEVAQLQKGDATCLEFQDGQFDLVYSYHALEHISNYRQALAEMNRVLKEGGWYCIGTPNRSRLVGYIGSEGTKLSTKIQWNLADWKARLTGRFRNEFGAHAGFTEAELSGDLKQVFGKTEDITLAYYLQLYPGYQKLLGRLSNTGLSRFVFPSIYYIGKK